MDDPDGTDISLAPTSPEADQLSEMVESAPDGLLMTDADGVIVQVNRHLEQLFGYERSEVVGQHVEFLLPEADRQRHVEHRARYAASPHPRSLGNGPRLRGRHADGSDIPVEVSLSPLTSNEGRAGVVAAVRDISERLAMHARLRESELRFRGAFHDGPVPMALVDLTPPNDRVIVEANDAMAELLGYERDELIGRSFADLTHPDDRTPDDAAVAEMVSGARQRYRPIKRYLRRDGSVVWVQLHAAPLTRGPGRVLGIAHAMDITHERAADAMRARHEAMVEAVSDVRAAMLGGASRAQGLTVLCGAVTNCLDASIALILTPEGTGDHLAVESSVNLSDEVRSAFAFTSTTGVVGEVFRSGEPEIVSAGDARYPPATQALLERFPVESIVVAPLLNGATTVGVLLVVRTAGAAALGEEDLSMIGAFASEAVVAIELAEANESRQRLAIAEDRDRIARDMHDKVIGRLFGAGMSILASSNQVADVDVQHRLNEAVDELDETVKEIRTTIYGIRSQADWGRGVRGKVLEIAADQREVLGFEPEVTLTGAIDDLPGDIVDAALATLREALTNVAKYAAASNAYVEFRVDDAAATLRVEDDGRGFAPADRNASHAHTHHGLVNMRDRALALGGRFDARSRPGDGVTVEWVVPVDPTERD